MSSSTKQSAEAGSLPKPVPALDRFHRVAEAGIDTRHYVGLDRNERLSPFPDWFMENIRESVQSTLLTCYPVQDELERQLSDDLQLPLDQILLTPSSDAAMKAVYQAYVRPGDGVLMLDPSYAMFPVYADMFEANAVPVGFDSTPALDTERLLESVTPDIRLIMIANPNQPTATLLDENIILELAQRAASVGALLVMDEAYYPFSHLTVLPWVNSYPNLLVMRTFSKAAGLAGLRIGFVAGHQEVISNLYKLRTVNDMNSMAMLCVNQILKHPEIVSDYVAEVEDGGRLLAERVLGLGLTPLPTHANFMLIRVAHRCHPKLLVEALKNRGYLVKGLDAPCIVDCIRVTLGPPDMMARFADCLQDVLQSDLPQEA